MKTLISTVDLETGEILDKGYYNDSAEIALIKYAKKIGYRFVTIDIDRSTLYLADPNRDMYIMAKQQ